MPHDVFISHSSIDKKIADSICAELEARDIKCWITPRDIAPGEDWGASIVDAINNARLFLLVFSQNSNDSNHVKREVERAVNKGLSILPFRIEDTRLSRNMEYFLSTTQWLDATGLPSEGQIKQLVPHIQQILSVSNSDSIQKPLADLAKKKNAQRDKNKKRGKGIPFIILAVLVLLVLIIYKYTANITPQIEIEEQIHTSIEYKECVAGLTYSADIEASMLANEGAQTPVESKNVCEKVFENNPDLPEAVRLYARSLVRSGQYEKALTFFKQAAQMEDNHANLVLGIYYLLWHKGDRKPGIGYLEAAAKSESIEAILQLGKNYELGLLELPDYSKAAHYYNSAVEQLSIEGYFKLAQLYQFGLGVPKDQNKAIGLYKKAAAFNHEPAIEALNEISNPQK